MQGRRDKAVAEATARIRHKAQAFKRCLRDHPDGAYVILSLKQEFLPSTMFSSDPYQNAANAMARDIIDYIERMVRFEEEQPHVAEEVLLPER